MGNIEQYLSLLNQFDESECASVDELARKMESSKNEILVLLYELKSLGWVETRDISFWSLTESGIIARKLLSPTKQMRDIELTKDNINILVTFPREFGDISKNFPNFIDTADVFKNEMKSIEIGGEILILSYAVDFNVLSEILEDPNIVKKGKERDIACIVQYFRGYNENEIPKLRKSGFNIRTNKVLMSGPGQPHAKIIIFKKKEGNSMIISSANLTDNVFRTRNLEIGIFTKDEVLVNEIERFYHWLWKKTNLD